ncbi:LPS export ABC transporter permease LptG [Catenovulum sp. 2E275]|uniref:LPS export ABC transporter permease LptG n=1 Tax=Catenovulum sp. 2E275 TaxID=2980497 RepID=UPI0021D219A5|nr:LPS export ABC transporter permease LptG [Catenovulum sp. 2E275]MCU4677499.1 LPS export ABC transporter permease LptG [Catenovulum sp. 2E275]
MIRILDWYIGRAIVTSTFFALLVLTALSGLIRFVEQLRLIGRGSYAMSDAAMFVIFSIARDLEVFFPMAALLGGLLGLGALATNSELIVMQAAGLSKLDIIKSVMKTTTIMVVLVLLVGEFLAPKMEQTAEKLKDNAIYGSKAEVAAQAIWLKDGAKFVHVGDSNNLGHLKDITIYDFSDELELTQVTHAQDAIFQNHQWQLKDLSITSVSEQSIQRFEQDSSDWKSNITPDKLAVVSSTPESLSLVELSDYLEYLDQNEQDASRYQLAFWRKILQPITVAVMMLMALSFIFGPLRSTSMGARILLGVMTGFGFFIANRIFGPVVLVYSIPPVVGAIMPSVIFTLIALHLLKKR